MIDKDKRQTLLIGSGVLLAGSLASEARATPDIPLAPTENITAFAVQRGGAADASVAFNAAFKAFSDDRVSPPSLSGWGLGAITAPRGLWIHRTPVRFVASQVGLAIRGDAPYATTHVFDITSGAALPFKTYNAVVLSDFYLRNTASTRGTSAGIGLDPVDGGGPLTIKRLAIDGFGTGIKLTGVGNGDKTLVEQVWFGSDVGFDNGKNKQAVGWTFSSCSGACPITHFRLGGAGEVAIGSYVGDVFGSFIELPEHAGNGGSGGYPARLTVTGTKLEYHGSGSRLLIDARLSHLATDQRGTNADVVLRDVSIASGTSPPDPQRHVVMQVGDDQTGSDSIRVRQDGGWIEGVIRHGSHQQGALNRRWSFRDAVRAPDPRRVDLRGIGNHPLMEWRANENVPVDQYRGGQGFTGSIDAQKAYLWRHSGSALLNTGVEAKRIDGRVGGDFVIEAFPAGTTQLGLGVYLDEALADGVDLKVSQFADLAFGDLIDGSLALPAGTRKGLYRVHDKWQVLNDGKIAVRVTLPGAGRAVKGALVVFYFPYMGS